MMSSLNDAKVLTFRSIITVLSEINLVYFWGCNVPQLLGISVGAQLVGYHLHLLQVLGCQRFGLCVHIVQHRAVDADGGIGAGVRLHSLWVWIQEDAPPCKSALYRRLPSSLALPAMFHTATSSMSAEIMILFIYICFCLLL